MLRKTPSPPSARRKIPGFLQLYDRYFLARRVVSGHLLLFRPTRIAISAASCGGGGWFRCPCKLHFGKERQNDSEEGRGLKGSESRIESSCFLCTNPSFSLVDCFAKIDSSSDCCAKKECQLDGTTSVNCFLVFSYSLRTLLPLSLERNTKRKVLFCCAGKEAIVC